MGKKEARDISAEERIKALEMSKISISIKTYNDIFSDFDPRPSSVRALSDDFLSETKKASKHKKDFELRFIAPSGIRNLNEERVIRRRLKEQFREDYMEIRAEVMGMIRLGIVFVIAGIIMMFLATVILFKYSDKSFIFSFMIIFFEPAGWFFFWEGLNHIILKPRERREDLKFYDKMSNCTVTFFSY